MKRIKNKKIFIAIIGMLLVVVVGATYALFSTGNSLASIFNVGNYNVITSETFTSPASWEPGVEIPKSITATNNGNIQATFRVKYTEKWENASGEDITSQVPNNTVSINFINGHDWAYNSDDGYYYYKWIVEPEMTTSSLLSGVTLNQDLVSNVSCDTTGNTYNCSSDLSGFAGATYTLTFTKETVAYSKYQSFWDTDQIIGEYQYLYSLPNGRTADTLQVGDEICINGDTTECFNFYGYDGNNIKLLSKYNLNVGNNIQPGVEGVQNSLAIGANEDSSTKVDNYFPATVAFSGTNYWVDGYNLKSKYGSDWRTSNIYDTDYNEASGDNYSVAYYVENYKNTLESYGLTVNDARLLTLSEEKVIKNNGFIASTSFWLGTAGGNNSTFAFRLSSDIIQSGGFNSGVSFGVRPVIVVSKSEINKNVVPENRYSIVSLPNGKTKDNLIVGDEICVEGDTTECFNFIGYDGNNIKLLSKYNLNVGNNIQPGVEGVQNSLAIGQNSDSSTAVDGYYPATVKFSETNYWADGSNLKSEYGTSFPADVYDTDYNEATGNNYSVVYYVENYKNTLESYGLTVNDARLLTYSEAIDESIGCDGDNRECPTGFITNTTFWLGSASDVNKLWTIGYDCWFGGDYFNYNLGYGVRPVIVISKSDI